MSIKPIIPIVGRLIVHFPRGVLPLMAAAMILHTQGCGGPPLEPWHTEKLTEEFTVGKVDEIRTFDDYLRVDCFDFRSMSEDSTKALERQSRATVERWEKRGDLCGPISNVDLKLPSVNVAPYSVYPFPSDICAALLMNAMAIVSTLNVSEVLRRSQKRGWAIVKDPQAIIAEVSAAGGDPRTEAGLAHIEKGACSMILPPSILGRLALEFLRPRAVLRELDQMFDEGPTTEGRFLNFYPNDRKIWR